MKISLRTKILASFTFIIIVSLGLAVGVGNRITRERYADFSVYMDEGRARFLSRVFGEWVSQVLDAREDGRAPDFGHPLFVTPDEIVATDDVRRREGNSPGFMGQMMNRMNNDRIIGPDPPAFNSLVVTDLSGQVLLDTAEFGKRFINPGANRGVQIDHGGRAVGYLYLGNMVPGSPLPREASFLQTAGKLSWILAAVIFFFAMILGLLLTYHIITPVKALNTATSRVKAGDLTVRVPEKRQDELGELSRGFNAMTDALEESDNKRRRLIADSAHELRTPVSLIRTRIEMMEEGVYPMDGESLAALSGESDRLVKLVEELRFLVDLESPETRPVKVQVDVAHLISDVYSALEPKMQRSGIAVETGSPSISVMGDFGQLHRLLSNLLNNALRYANSTIRLTSRPVSGGVEIAMEDDGPGIPEDDRERVFDRYFRVDSSRSRDSGGSGLGLAICKEIVSGHGGLIRASESSELGGAKITVFVPET